MFMAYLGKRAVYRATGFLIPVTIEELHLEPDFGAKLAAIDGIALCYNNTLPRPKLVFTVSAAWSYLHVESHSWSLSVSGCCWRVILDEAGCDAVVKLCKEKAGLAPDVLFQMADLIYKCPPVKDIPDIVDALREGAPEGAA
jgi:hypothetical protein